MIVSIVCCILCVWAMCKRPSHWLYNEINLNACECMREYTFVTQYLYMYVLCYVKLFNLIFNYGGNKDIYDHFLNTRVHHYWKYYMLSMPHFKSDYCILAGNMLKENTLRIFTLYLFQKSAKFAELLEFFSWYFENIDLK